MKAVLLTPAGPAAIAVVRIAGAEVPAFLASHFSARPRIGRPVHGDLQDGDGRVIDDPVVVLVNEQVADLNLHGGPWVVRSALALLERAGFEVRATPPTDPLSVFEGADDADVLWQEVTAHLPRARTEQAVRLLLAQPRQWQRLCTSPPDAAAARDILADRTLRQMLRTPKVAIVGPANVGKSTLANHWFGRERSIVADLPGTTRDWVDAPANLSGLAVTLVDTPGIRATDDAIEQSAIAQAEGQITTADLVLVVLDGARPLDAEQRAVLELYPAALVVVNKTDAPAAWDVASVAGHDARPIAARTGVGLDALTGDIANRLGCRDPEIHRPLWWTDRQKAWLESQANRPT